MVLVVEMTEQTKAVKLIVMISIVQTLQKLQLLQTSLVPGRHIAYNVTQLLPCLTFLFFQLQEDKKSK